MQRITSEEQIPPLITEAPAAINEPNIEAPAVINEADIEAPPIINEPDIDAMVDVEGDIIYILTNFLFRFKFF